MKLESGFVGSTSSFVLMPESQGAVVLGAHGGEVKLTPREMQISRLWASGQKRYAISENLGLSIKTVEKHIQAAYKKLGVSHIQDFIHLALARGWIENKYATVQASIKIKLSA